MRLRSTASAPPQLMPAGGTAALRPRTRDKQGFAKLAVDHGFLAQSDVARVDMHAREHGLPFHEAAVEIGALDAEAANLLAALAGGFSLLPMGDERIDPVVVAAFDPASPYAAKIRTIRAKMRGAAKAGDPSALRLAVLSVNAGDEAAVMAANLAVVLAQIDGQTMLIDVDIGNPSLDRLFRVANKAGLAEQLMGSAALLPAAKTAIEGLWLMTAGRASGSAASMITRGPLADTVNGWGLKETSMLFYLAERKGDQTPFGSMLAGFDAVVIAARRGDTTIADLRRIIDDLDRQGVPIAGTVIT